MKTTALIPRDNAVLAATAAREAALARLVATARPDFMAHYGSARLLADRTAR